MMNAQVNVVSGVRESKNGRKKRIVQQDFRGYK